MKHWLTSLLLGATVSAANAQGYTELDYYSVSDVEALATVYGLPSALFTPITGVQAYRLEYYMPFQGDTILVSGAVFEPTDLAADCANPVHLYAHGTVFERDNTPSFLNYEGELGFLMAGLGFTVVMPDYVGLGTDDAHLHPYVHALSEAEACVYLLDALFSTDGMSTGNHDPDQVFLSGYSQGGHAAMAAHRMLQEERPQYHVVASAPGSGPYDISGTQFPWTFADPAYSNPAYLAYVALAWQSVYGNLYSDLNEYFLEPFASDLPALFDGQTSGAAINAALPTLTADFAQPDLLNTLLEADNPFLAAAEDNDVYDWAPEAPTRLYYCTEDEQVYYENALVAEAAMSANGASDVQALNLGAYDHGGCAGQAIFGAALWFSTLATTCEPWSVSESHPEAAPQLAPNPATSSTLWTELPSNSTWIAYDLGGRHVASGKGQRINVAGWPEGVYLIEAEGKTARLSVHH